MELAKTVSDKRAIAKQLDLHESDVYRMFQKGFVPHETGARYFSDFERGPEWFAAL